MLTLSIVNNGDHHCDVAVVGASSPSDSLSGSFVGSGISLSGSFVGSGYSLDGSGGSIDGPMQSDGCAEL
jgi:hypothetical protein